MEIIPAILPKSLEELNAKISLVANEVDVIQIDICDGVFVENKTVDFDFLPHQEEVEFELDLMVKNAKDDFDKYLALNPKRIIFHLEAEEGLKEFIETLDPEIRDKVEIGVAINTTTLIKKLKSLLNVVDFIQCMGIKKIGVQGQPFDKKVLEHISELKREITLSVDGGVNKESIELLDVDRLVIGSYIFNNKNPVGVIKSLV
ncbi:MAG: hypothetical protein U9P50_02200 [Patescibacteria group bacterium]|nr:hypothetical protein [Patescibacteria group bacterium]